MEQREPTNKGFYLPCRRHRRQEFYISQSCERHAALQKDFKIKNIVRLCFRLCISIHYLYLFLCHNSYLGVGPHLRGQTLDMDSTAFGSLISAQVPDVIFVMMGPGNWSRVTGGKVDFRIGNHFKIFAEIAPPARETF